MKEQEFCNYEMICFFSGKERIKKEELVQKIQNLVLTKLEEKKLEKNKLAWPIEVENYLLFHMKVNPKIIQQIEKIIQQSLVQYLLINLDKEKQIKLRKVKAVEKSDSKKESSQN